MAEVLGVVASGIAITQLAGQVTKTITKLKEYWDQVQEAPAEIKYLLREIDSLNLILCHIQDNQSRQTTGVSDDNICIRQSLELCREGAQELQSLVDELAQKVDGRRGWRKKVGSVKVVLKKEETKRLKQRMKNAIRLLSLSYQWHTNSMVQLQHEIIVARMARQLDSLMVTSASQQIQQTLPKDDKNDDKSCSIVREQYHSCAASSSWMEYLLGKFEYYHCARRHRGRESLEIFARYNLPQFYSNTRWDFQGYSRLSGWRVNLQVYRTVSHDCAFFMAVGNGDISTVRQMLRAKKACITDRTHSAIWPTTTNRTALHVAAELGDVEMCEMLIVEGAEVLALDSLNQTPLQLAASSGGIISFHPQGRGPGNLIKTCRTLVNAGASELLIDQVDVLLEYHGSSEALEYLQQQAYPPYYDLPTHDRIAIARKYSMSRWHNMPLLIAQCLSKSGNIDSETANWVNEQGLTFLHILIKCFAETVCRFKTDERCFDDRMDSLTLEQLRATRDISYTWRALIRKFISAGCPVLAIDNRGLTVLSTLIEHYFSDVAAPWTIGQPHDMLRTFLEDLFECGIDLELYGAAEKSIWKGDRWVIKCFCGASDPWTDPMEQHGDDCFTGSIGFKYGPRPEDWVFSYFEEGKNSFAAEFWCLVEGNNESNLVGDSHCSDIESSLPEKIALPIPGSWIVEIEE